jgi:hypothetical protein
MSQNMIVSWRRSAGCSVAMGDRDSLSSAAIVAPHSAQNLACAGLSYPHAGHARGKAAPQSRQNLPPFGTSALQLGHRTATNSQHCRARG